MLGQVIREMAENGFACKDINAGSPDKRMSSTTRKTWQQVDQAGRQEGLARMVLAITKMADNKIESVVRRRTSSVTMSGGKVLADYGHGHDVVPVGKAEGDLGQNHLTTESLWAEMEKLILAQKAHLLASV